MNSRTKCVKYVPNKSDFESKVDHPQMSVFSYIPYFARVTLTFTR